MMFSRSLAVSTAVLLLLLFTWGSTQAEYTVISTLYYESNISPEKTDRFVRVNKYFFDRRFFSCLYGLRQAVGIEGANTAQFCGRFPDDQAAECRSNNFAVGVYFWTISIEEVIRGEKTWGETLIGRSAYQAKEAFELYEQMVPGSGRMAFGVTERVTRAIANMLICP